jgi:DNA polymerase-1
LIKTIFIAPPGWIFCGADFDALEDKIGALTTKDPNKLKVYANGYDAHCLRAFFYYREQMPDIEDTLESINSIETKYKSLRQASKTPTFALTYQGTAHTLVNNIGLSLDNALKIEANYHELYKVSDQWVNSQLEQATHDGYVTCAFGLRVRTPSLSNACWGSLDYTAAKEGRTAGNALGQSYGLLNNRSAIEMQDRVLNSKYKTQILPVAHIHDAQYFLVKAEVGCITWFNKNLVDCMSWQELPTIQHDIVKISASVDIFYPNWSKATPIPVNADKETIRIIGRKLVQ